MPSSFLYFAYGSNMLSRRLKARCSSAEVVGLAAAKEHRVEFSKKGKDGSGKANLVPDSDQQVWGVVYRIDVDHLVVLDKFEGVFGKPSNYERNEGFSVCMLDDESVAQTTTYIAPGGCSALAPYDWYLALILAGCREHDVDADYQAVLLKTTFAKDPNIANPDMLKAICILEASGHQDWQSLLMTA